MLEQRITVAVNAMADGFPLRIEYTISYDSEGPEFDDQIEGVPDPIITFTEEDIGWSYKLPPIVAEDQQDVEITFLQSFNEESQLFVYEESIKTLTLNP